MTATLPKEFKDSVGYVNYDILEDDEKTGRMRVRGVFQRADTKNANGRIYTSSLWEKTLHDPKVTEAIEGRRMLGEVEHPKDGVTNLARVSHIVTGLSRKGDEIVGEAEILNTPSGKIIQELFRAGTEVGISSRGRGTSQFRGGVEYVDESSFQLDTFDFVFKPSTPGAYPKLQESALHGSPYGRNSTMEEKLNELKRLEVRAMDILSESTKKTLRREEMQEWFEECIEIEASAETVFSNLTEDESKEHGEYVESVMAKVAEAKTTVTTKLDQLHEANDRDLDRRVTNAQAGIVESTSEAPATETTQDSSPQNETQIASLQALLKEAMDARDYYRSRLVETMEVLEADEDDLRKRYVAAKQLGEELLSQLKEAKGALAELAQDHEALEERYQAATQVIAGVVERQDRGRMIKLVREAIEMHPELEKFHKSLLSCESIEELEERLDEYKRALELPTQDKEEAMNSQVSLAAAKEEDDGGDYEEDGEEADEQLGENADLPGEGSSINESEDAEVLSQAGTFTESHEDRGVSAARRVVKNRPGWK